jgi:hypothetical protein
VSRFEFPSAIVWNAKGEPAVFSAFRPGSIMIASRVRGNASQYARVADSGNRLTFNFCPVCGPTVYWKSEVAPDLIAVAVGAFADQTFPAPDYSVWERTRHAWAVMGADRPVQHSDLPRRTLPPSTLPENALNLPANLRA